ncbi:hypothetical protein [Aquimarina sp. RZ0]|uniref:hypothetical protein n=1 Tax=Aquimarina sp. RZ0 TaxID=2607730 RepID=UPI0011F2F84A|nr:hypothetical protein [Aquimarina sp. RZ0]KAA1247452.1 hypothetical protein F0000_03055 [Aquimarina sp. RZ0]
MTKIEILILLRKIAYGTEFLAAATGLFFVYKNQINGLLKWFPAFLTYVFLNDIIGLNTKHLFSNSNNLILYNISTIVTFVFLFSIYYQYSKEKKNKRLIAIFLISYIISLFIYGFIENYLIQLQSIPFLLGSSLLMISIILYYAELLKEELLKNRSKDLLIWIGAGILIYYIGIIPFRLVRDYYAKLDDYSILFILNGIFTILMNICFIVGFIIVNKKSIKKKTPR